MWTHGVLSTATTTTSGSVFPSGVREHNCRSSFRVQLNRFPSHAPGEYRLLRSSSPAIPPEIRRSASSADASFNWRTRSPSVVVSPRDQGNCESD
jgi:hypothetical protein